MRALRRSGDLMNDRVQTHEKKPGVTAKTVGQKGMWRRFAATTSRSASGRRARARRTCRGNGFVSVGKKAARIILTRPAVEAGRGAGILPGDLYEDHAPYLRPCA